MGRGLHLATRQLVADSEAILQQQHPMTIRQLFYQLVSKQKLQNCLSHYQKISRVMTDARERGEISLNWIVDRSRPMYGGGGWADTEAYIASTAAAYHRDYWLDQDENVEVWCEKDAIVGSIEEVTKRWGVIIRVFKGFNSTTRVHEIASELPSGTHVLYLGDHDPSGRCIEEEGLSRIEDAGGSFELERIAIHPEDIKEYGLPPLRIKTSDPRAGGFLHRYGSQCVELDALSAKVLRERLEKRIVEFVNMEQWDRAMLVERVEMDSIRRLCNGWNKKIRRNMNRKIEAAQRKRDKERQDAGEEVAP